MQHERRPAARRADMVMADKGRVGAARTSSACGAAAVRPGAGRGSGTPRSAPLRRCPSVRIWFDEAGAGKIEPERPLLDLLRTFSSAMFPPAPRHSQGRPAGERLAHRDLAASAGVMVSASWRLSRLWKRSAADPGRGRARRTAAPSGAHLRRQATVVKATLCTSG